MLKKKYMYARECSNAETLADHLVDAIQPFFIDSIIRVGFPLLIARQVRIRRSLRQRS